MWLDPQGRVFGKFSLIDLAFGLLAILLFVPTVAFGYALIKGNYELILFEVNPKQFRYGSQREIQIVGREFDRWTNVQIGSHPYQPATFVDSHNLRVSLPFDIPPGRYSIRARNHKNRTAELVNAFELLETNSPLPVRIRSLCILVNLRPADLRRLQKSLSRSEPEPSSIRLRSILTWNTMECDQFSPHQKEQGIDISDIPDMPDMPESVDVLPSTPDTKPSRPAKIPLDEKMLQRLRERKLKRGKAVPLAALEAPSDTAACKCEEDKAQYQGNPEKYKKQRQEYQNKIRTFWQSIEIRKSSPAPRCISRRWALVDLEFKALLDRTKNIPYSFNTIPLTPGKTTTVSIGGMALSAVIVSEPTLLEILPVNSANQNLSNGE